MRSIILTLLVNASLAAGGINPPLQEESQTTSFKKRGSDVEKFYTAKAFVCKLHELDSTDPNSKVPSEELNPLMIHNLQEDECIVATCYLVLDQDYPIPYYIVICLHENRLCFKYNETIVYDFIEEKDDDGSVTMLVPAIGMDREWYAVNTELLKLSYNPPRDHKAESMLDFLNFPAPMPTPLVRSSNVSWTINNPEDSSDVLKIKKALFEAEGFISLIHDMWQPSVLTPVKELFQKKAANPINRCVFALMTYKDEEVWVRVKILNDKMEILGHNGQKYNCSRNIPVIRANGDESCPSIDELHPMQEENFQ